MILDHYRPRPDWFAHNPYGIHGISHVSRVLVWADAIARWLLDQRRRVDVEVVRWAAVLHDVGRVDDGADPEHGERSAAWAREHHRLLPAALSDEQIEGIAYCCIWHVPRDTFAPHMTIELTCLKDADGLDRVRIHDLDPYLLRTDYARGLEPQAWKLYEATAVNLAHDPLAHDPWDRVREVAMLMGLWR